MFKTSLMGESWHKMESKKSPQGAKTLNVPRSFS